MEYVAIDLHLHTPLLNNMYSSSGLVKILPEDVVKKIFLETVASNDGILNLQQKKNDIINFPFVCKYFYSVVSQFSKEIIQKNNRLVDVVCDLLLKTNDSEDKVIEFFKSMLFNEDKKKIGQLYFLAKSSIFNINLMKELFDFDVIKIKENVLSFNKEFDGTELRKIIISGGSEAVFDLIRNFEKYDSDGDVLEKIKCLIESKRIFSSYKIIKHFKLELDLINRNEFFCIIDDIQKTVIKKDECLQLEDKNLLQNNQNVRLGQIIIVFLFFILAGVGIGFIIRSSNK